MSEVRVLVGTRKGAFILTSDGKRERWDVSGPHFAGWEIYHLKGSPVDPNRIYASQTSGWFGQIIQRSDDGGKTWHQPGTPPGEPTTDAGRHAQGREQQVRLRHVARNRQAAHHAPVVRRHAAPLGVQARLAPRAVADRSGYRLRRGRRRRPVPLDRRRQDLARAGRPARPRHRAQLAAGRRRHGPAHDPPRSEQSRADVHRHLGRGRVPHRRRRQDLEADQPRPAVAVHPRPERRGRPLRAPHRDAPVAPERAVHAEALGRHAQRQRRRLVARGQRQPADRLRLPDRRARPRAGHHLRRADQERLGALSARGQAARLPQPDGRQRVGGAHEGPAARDCYVNVLRDAMAVDSLDPCGVYFGTTGGQVYASADAGDSWAPIVRDLPAVLSVEVQTLP